MEVDKIISLCLIYGKLSNLITSKKSRRGRKPEFPGLTEDAAKLGVSRYFLWSCLKGHAVSAPLLTRYRALKKNQEASA